MPLCSEKGQLHAWIGSVGWRDFQWEQSVCACMCVHAYVCVSCVASCREVWSTIRDTRSTSDSSVRQTSGVILLENIHSCWRGSVKTAMLEIMASLLSCYCYAFLPKFISTSRSVYLVTSTWSCMECGSWDVINVPRSTLLPFCCCIEFTLLWIEKPQSRSEGKLRLLLFLFCSPLTAVRNLTDAIAVCKSSVSEGTCRITGINRTLYHRNSQLTLWACAPSICQIQAWKTTL